MCSYFQEQNDRWINCRDFESSKRQTGYRQTVGHIYIKLLHRIRSKQTGRPQCDSKCHSQFGQECVQLCLNLLSCIVYIYMHIVNIVLFAQNSDMRKHMCVSNPLWIELLMISISCFFFPWPCFSPSESGGFVYGCDRGYDASLVLGG